jgi:hypothetical protein
VANNKGQLGGGVKQAGSLCLTFFPSSASRAPTSADSWPCNSSPNILFLSLSSRTHTLRPRVAPAMGLRVLEAASEESSIIDRDR